MEERYLEQFKGKGNGLVFLSIIIILVLNSRGGDPNPHRDPDLFLGLPDPHQNPLVTSTDPDTAPNPSIVKQKWQRSESKSASGSGCVESVPMFLSLPDPHPDPII